MADQLAKTGKNPLIYSPPTHPQGGGVFLTEGQGGP